MIFSKGLEGVVVDETAVSNVEGDIGRLTYRGYPVEGLVVEDYTAVVWMVLFGELPNGGQRQSLEKYLAVHGLLSKSDKNILKCVDRASRSMEMLQGMIPLLQLADQTYAETDLEVSQGLQIVAKTPTLIAAYYRLQGGLLPVDFEPELSYLGNFLSMSNVLPTDVKRVEVLKVVQILQMEHSFNAGTFASKCVSSTLASIKAVMAAGVGALSVELHGGADEAAVKTAKGGW